MADVVESALNALLSAREQLEGYELDATGESYNDTQINAAIEALRARVSQAGSGECCDGYEAQIAVLQQVIKDRDATIAALAPSPSASVEAVLLDDLRKRTERAGPGFHVALSYREMKLVLASLTPAPTPVQPPDLETNFFAMTPREVHVALATPSAPVSVPSPAGGVREALERAAKIAEMQAAECKELQCEPERDERSSLAWGMCRNTAGIIADAIRALALSSPATPEPVSASANGEVARHSWEELRYIIFSEVTKAGAREGAENAAIKIAALSNPAPGHGEGG